jgi:hypothetical protein
LRQPRRVERTQSVLSTEAGCREPTHKGGSESGKEWRFLTLRFSTSKQSWQPPSEHPAKAHFHPPSYHTAIPIHLIILHPLDCHHLFRRRPSNTKPYNPLAPKHLYESVGYITCDQTTSRKGKGPDLKGDPCYQTTMKGREPIQQSSKAPMELANMCYMLDGPMAPAWVLRGMAKGHVGIVEALQE